MLLTFTLLQNQDTLEDTLKRKDIFIKSPVKAALMSAVIPGWGQFYNGKTFKGLVLGGFSFASLAWTLKTFNDYKIKGDNESVSNFLGALIVNIAVWGYTIADAFVDAYLYGFEAERDTVLKDIEVQKH